MRAGPARCSLRRRSSSPWTCSPSTARRTCCSFSCIGGAGYLYGGLLGAIVFKVLQDFLLRSETPQYWQFWIGLILVALVLVGRERLTDRVRGLWAQGLSRLSGRQQAVRSTRPGDLT